VNHKQNKLTSPIRITENISNEKAHHTEEEEDIDISDSEAEYKDENGDFTILKISD